MKKFNVVINYTLTEMVTVEAEDEQDAKNKAFDASSDDYRNSAELTDISYDVID